MRTARLLGEGRSFYHCVSRVVGREIVFKDKDKAVFRKMMRSLEAFLGVRVVTYCFMGNHFHLLIEVPDEGDLERLSEDEILGHLEGLYEPLVVDGVRQELERAHAAGNDQHVREILDRFEKRRGQLSEFMKSFKQRITSYMNKRLKRRGTFWEGRYKSVLVEGSEMALLTVAAYIDLNPVRAGLVKRPEDYRWCGYSEAISGTRGAHLARKGLGLIMAECLSDDELRTDWRRTMNRYRQFLYEEGEAREANEITGEGARRGMESKTVEAVVDRHGAMTIPEALRCRVRYFCDGAILGSAGFVEGVFLREQANGRADPKRGSGARRMRGASWGALRSYRDLRKDVVGVP